ncbi:hypothetical protein NIES2107_46290 [Nostoc carneum NIES-2107]|nr:hypothetical protein NIES2107_46290 [Nostoc carneum NIES-2107]
MGVGEWEQGQGARGQGAGRIGVSSLLSSSSSLILLIFIAPLENFPYFSLPFAQFIFRTIFLHSALKADAQNQRHLSDRYFGTILGTGLLIPLV